jgi:hypothetical protein
MGFCYRAENRLSPGAQFLMDAIRGIAEKRSLPLTERPIPL